MSQLLIQQYLNDLAKLRKVSGSSREGVVSEAFKDLLKGYARQHGLTFISQYKIITTAKENRYLDGALMYANGLPFGYYEAKDEKDDLDTEIEFKAKRGYPQDNIIFEDSITAVLIQNREQVGRCLVKDVKELEVLLDNFFAFERPEITEFRKGLEQFKFSLPTVLSSLREMIEKEQKENSVFSEASKQFLGHIKNVINPNLTPADVREMLIQHILTEELFHSVFSTISFHQENNIARELYQLENTFFKGNIRHSTLKSLGSYYAAIRTAAAQIGSYHEKQSFLKIIYENFYKVYNPKAADRLGVVYTPNEIVRFMIQGTDWLCEKHFGRNLIDKDVDILDPATGTGTFICELIEHFTGQPSKLAYKYHHELHANEVAILPYYVANLNIEATYAEATDKYEEFPGMCFVDTLDNTFALANQTGRQGDLFSISEANVKRIQQQNKKKISVIIGNPPYNANQLNENENNKNREYPWIDKRIKETYIKASTAQKTKLYDMYARFFRWAADRLDENGVLALITNRSFIESRTFDGFRAVVAKEFSEIRVVDLGGDVRANPKLSGTTNNVFGIQTGVAISFMVRKAKQKGCQIYYVRRPEMERADEKLAFLSSTGLGDIKFEEIRPDAKHNWINLTDNDFDTLLPLATKETKRITDPNQERAIFRLFSLGIATNRDEWVYALNRNDLTIKMTAFIEGYESERKRWKNAGRSENTSDWVKREIKWTTELENYLKHDTSIEFNSLHIRNAQYRPFVKRYVYYDKIVIHRLYQQDSIFPLNLEDSNITISFNGSNGVHWDPIASRHICDLNGLYGGTQTVPFFRFDTNGTRTDNITDWALEQFQAHYKPGKGKRARAITKEAIFHYVYGILHDPVYREKYAQNLKREFPRIPFYTDFWQWTDWGKTLMDLHIEYETVEPYPLQRVDIKDEKAFNAGYPPKALLKADKEEGTIRLDTETILSGIPKEAWEYKLGNRCALEWILDQYKEKTPKDPTIREKFNTYRFADYKEKVIDLLTRVTTVSMKTVGITEEMKRAERE